jgi:D-erythritol 1-phosphate dehydrogenase
MTTEPQMIDLFVIGGRKKLPGTRTLDLRRDPEGAPILDQYTKGFE